MWKIKRSVLYSLSKFDVIISDKALPIKVISFLMKIYKKIKKKSNFKKKKNNGKLMMKLI